MRFVTFRAAGGYRLGLQTEGGTLDLAALAAAVGLDLPVTPAAFYRAGLGALPAFRRLTERPTGDRFLIAAESLALGPAVLAPEKIICVGLNYRRHAAEAGMAVPQTPVLFGKYNNALAGSDEPIPIAGLEKVDYEAELAVVLGRAAKAVPVEEALDYVLGYTNANDVSDRSLQHRTSQWLLGKTPDKFLPLGPTLVTADEVPNPQALAIRGRLNGELRQNSTTADMIFSVAEIIAYASRHITLTPGDVILTGTPEGVIDGRAEKRWLRAGDVYEVEIGDFGRLRCPFGEGETA